MREARPTPEALTELDDNLVLTFASGERSLSVRSFNVREVVSEPFAVSVSAVSRNADLDLGGLVGRAAALRIATFDASRTGGSGRCWSGLCSHIEQTRVEPDGHSTYALRIVPTLWRLTQRRDYRIFQHLSVPELVDAILSPWGIKPLWRADRSAFPRLHYKVQYGETDFAFLSRLTEEAGIAYTFTDDEEGARPTFFSDLGMGDHRDAPPIRDVGTTAAWSSSAEEVSNVHVTHRTRPGAFAVRDFDLRRPREGQFAEARKARPTETRLETYLYRPGTSVVESAETGAGATPVADDRGGARHDDPAGTRLAELALQAARGDARVVGFDTNVLELAPGVVFSLASHAQKELSDGARLLVTGSTLEGSHDGKWRHAVQAVLGNAPFRPAQRTPKPRIVGVQCAVVVGPKGEEIHTDEFGRVRVQFAWDREGRLDDASSCWIRVSQGWGGASFGMAMIPRVGHEVLVGFADGDPDLPFVVGRMYNATAPVPHALPRRQTISTWKSDSSPGSEGFNEIRYDDAKGEELVYQQAERNQRCLVKNDETITVGRDRDKKVEGSETDTTHGDRTEVTKERRKETTVGSKTTDLRSNRSKLIAMDEREDSRSHRTIRVRGDLDVVTFGTRTERVEADDHAHVVSSRSERTDGAHSLTVVSDQHEEVGGTYSLASGETLHLVAGDAFCGEAADLTLKGPGGFVRIHGGGVTIGGTLVKINTGGRSMTGRGVRPREPSEAEVADVLGEDEEPPR